MRRIANLGRAGDRVYEVRMLRMAAENRLDPAKVFS
jgi:hypothetical protein